MINCVWSWLRSWLPASLNDLKRTETKIMAKLSELEGQVNALNAVVVKIAAEVQKLIDALANVDIPAAAQTALDNLAANLKAVDDLNPDEPPPPPPVP